MRTRLFAAAVSSVFVSLLATPASAQYGAVPAVPAPLDAEYHVEVFGGFWGPTPSIILSSEQLGIPGTDIDFVDDLGISRKQFTGLDVVLRPGRSTDTGDAAAQASCGIGSGITADAQPDAEWTEWRHKRAFVERASMPFEILETLGLHEGKFPHASLHLRRMGEAAAHFGYPFSAHAVRQELQVTALRHLRATRGDVDIVCAHDPVELDRAAVT